MWIDNAIFYCLIFLVKIWVKTKLMMMMMTTCFCGIVDQQKAFSLISSQDHCQRSSPSRISDTPWAEFEPVQNLNSGFVECSCEVVITTTPFIYQKILKLYTFEYDRLVGLHIKEGKKQRRGRGTDEQPGKPLLIRFGKTYSTW